MRTLTNEFGQTLFMPDNIIERRGVVNGLKLFDVENGIATSQSAKYEKPKWAFISDLLVGYDKMDTGALTCHEISAKLEPHGIFFKPHAIFNIIQQMIHPRKASHRHNRRIGQSCVEVVNSFGGVKSISVRQTIGGVTYDTHAYFFGAPHDEVIRLRRAFAEIISRKP